MDDFFDTLRDGVGVNVRVDTSSAIVLGVVLLGALTLSLAIYAKFLR